MPVPTSDLISAIAVVTFAALVQGVVGIGFNVVAVPTLLLINPLLAPVPSLLLAVPLTIWQLLREKGSIDRSGVGWILLGRFPGGLIGLGLLLLLSARVLDLAIAGIVLVAVAIVGSGTAVRRTRATEFGTGVVSGITGIVGAIGGPPVGILYRDTPGPIMRSTVAVVFSVGLLMSIGLRALGGQMNTTDLEIALYLAPGMVVGFAVSGVVKDRVEGPLIRRGILIISTIAATALLLRGIFG